MIASNRDRGSGCGRAGRFRLRPGCHLVVVPRCWRSQAPAIRSSGNRRSRWARCRLV